MQQSELLRQTIELVRNRRRGMTYKVISAQTGLKVQFLQDLMAGRLKNPGVVCIEKLYTHMTQTKLALNIA